MLCFNYIAAIAVFALGATSAPIDSSPVRSLENTATPAIGVGYTAQQQTVRILDGIHRRYRSRTARYQPSGLVIPRSKLCIPSTVRVQAVVR
jgi:hypothetical protein